MKKTLVSALTTALVVGAASTTFAAANPFQDVPADHWAYDAVAQLAADGVIEGYGDGTYRGDQEITRYEMAQMVARAMAKGGNGADKALIDKLAAEFADELNNLGVRVSALEKKVDNVKWGGMVRFRWNRRIEEGQRNENNHDGWSNEWRLRLEPQMEINKNWTGKARIDYNNGNGWDNGTNGGNATVDRAWVEGKYNNFTVKLGRFFAKQESDYAMTNASRMTGVEATFGKDILVTLRATRMHNRDIDANGPNAPSLFSDANTRTGKGLENNESVSYQGIEVYNNRKNKFTWGLGYQQVKGDAIDQVGYTRNAADDTVKRIGVWDIGLGYKFTPDFNATVAWAQANGVKGRRDHKGYKNSAHIQLNYKGANKAKAGSWGAFLAYRHLGNFSTIHPNCREVGMMNGGEKGWEIGLSWAPMKNVVGLIQYYKGKELVSGNKVGGIWTELGFYF
ncbi:MAG: S-layer homology domain-containing protein [Schwartzia sp.]|nr:S-layer homology domain-containing protein [Schwartzia sp. (in: firmicutes)]